MPKRHHDPYAASGNSRWSIDANGLTAAGESELLKDLGRRLQQTYQNVLKEPAPDHIKHLLERLERSQRYDEDEDL